MLNIQKFSLSGNTEVATVPFRATLLEALFPTVNFRIVIASVDPADRPAMIEKLAQPLAGFQIDFASGSRKHGDFWFSDAPTPVSATFWDSAEKAIAYGGCLVTDCQSIIRQELTVLVVRDGEFETGDCHGKASDRFFAGLRVYADTAIQFRLAVLNSDGTGKGHLAKGTLAVGDVPPGVDLVVPVSAFKSFVPALGIHAWSAVFGLVSVSEVRPTRVGYSILQWFSPSAIEADVLPHAEAVVTRLIKAASSTQAAVEYFKLDELDAAEEDTGDDQQLLHRVLAADIHQQLNHHPYVVDRIARHLRRRWLHCALGGGLRWSGLMGLPNDTLPLGTVCAPGLPEGELIFTRYPVRSWADVRLVRNVHSVDGQPLPHLYGCAWMSHQTAALVGGDFDGDYFIVTPATDFPNLTFDIKSWSGREVPPVVKVKDRRSSPLTTDHLARVGMENTDNLVGLITFLIASACANGRMDLVNQLAPQLQIAVDKFKYNLENDPAVIEVISKQLTPPAWLAGIRKLDGPTGTPQRSQGYKDPDTFLRVPLAVSSTESDPISRLARVITARWQPAQIVSRPLEEFAPVFPRSRYHQEAAIGLCTRYAKLMKEACQREDRTSSRHLLGVLREWALTRTDSAEWAAEVWRAAHSRHSRGCASIAFNAFTEQVCQVLAVAPPAPASATIVGLKYGEWVAGLERFDGKPFSVSVVAEVVQARVRSVVYIDGRRLGLVSSETPVPPGTYVLALVRCGNVVEAAIPQP